MQGNDCQWQTATDRLTSQHSSGGCFFETTPPNYSDRNALVARREERVHAGWSAGV